MDVLNAMRVFAAVVENGSFVSAAERLGMSSASVSRQLAALEDHLGARLLNRTTRRLALTDAGQDYLTRTQAILADVAAAEARVGRGVAKPVGVLRVSAPMSFGALRMSRWLPGFAELYPDLKVDLDLTDTIADLTAGSVDVAIRIMRSLPPSSMISRRIGPVKSVICAAPRYLDQRGRPATPADLVAHSFLGFKYRPHGHSLTFLGPAGQHDTIRLHSQLHANNGENLIALAMQGMGIVDQPRFAVDPHIAAGQLEPLLPGWTIEDRSLFVLYAARKFLPAKIRVFVDYLAGREG